MIFYFTITSFILLSIQMATTNGSEYTNHYEEGQIWTYKTRKNEKDSHISIINIDTDNKSERNFFIFVTSLKTNKSNRKTNDLEKLIVSEETLNKSVIECVGQVDKTEDFLEFHQSWKTDFASKNIPVWDSTISNILDNIDKYDDVSPIFNEWKTNLRTGSISWMNSMSLTTITTAEQPFKAKINWLKRILTCCYPCRKSIR